MTPAELEANSEFVTAVALALGAAIELAGFRLLGGELLRRRKTIKSNVRRVKVSEMKVDAFGLDKEIEGILDLIDCVQRPLIYADVIEPQNAILIVGGRQSGKETLAQAIAKRAGLHTMDTITNAHM